VFAAEVSAQVRLKGMSPTEAAQAALDRMAALGGRGGLIAVDAQGLVVAPFEGLGMKRAIATGAGQREVRILD
jgi:L-asparaginase/beta-aspartyl-peptidase (threonine type)